MSGVDIMCSDEESSNSSSEETSSSSSSSSNNDDRDSDYSESKDSDDYISDSNSDSDNGNNDDSDNAKNENWAQIPQEMLTTVSAEVHNVRTKLKFSRMTKTKNQLSIRINKKVSFNFSHMLRMIKTLLKSPLTTVVICRISPPVNSPLIAPVCRPKM